jgi:hypothetical protein
MVKKLNTMKKKYFANNYTVSGICFSQYVQFAGIDARNAAVGLYLLITNQL